MTRATGPESQWPDTTRTAPPVDGCYHAAVWLLGRHPDLARLAARIHGVITGHSDGLDAAGLDIDLDHLAAVVSAVSSYNTAWQDYKRRHRAPSADDSGYDTAYDAWEAAGPNADNIVDGLHDFLVMSSGEVARIRLLATLASEPAPFCIGDLRSLDTDGQRLLTDWTHAVHTAYGSPARHHRSTDRWPGREPGTAVETIPSL